MKRKVHKTIKHLYAQVFPQNSHCVRLKMKKFGLFIGVDNYCELNAATQCLHGAAADASALEELFRQQLGFHTALLLDKDLGLHDTGSHEAIYQQLNRWQANLQHNEEHLLVLYFAGHGSYANKQHFLLAPKAPKHALDDPVDGEIGIISETMLKRTSQRWPNVQRLFIFDACRAQLSAPQMAALASRVALGEAQDRVEVSAHEANLLILRSCQPQQLAFELREFGPAKKNHGLFTAAMLDVLQQGLDDQHSLEVNPVFKQSLHAQMQLLAKQHVPREPLALAQSPCLAGEAICLLTENEVAASKIQRVVREFEQRFAAAHYHEPTITSCAESLRELRSLKYPQEALQQLGQKLDAAVSAQRAAERRVKGEKLLAMARRTQSPEAYLKLLEQEFHEYEDEVEQFFATRDAERAALQTKAADAEKLAQKLMAELHEAKQKNEKISSEKHTAEQAWQAQQAQVEQLQRENTQLQREIEKLHQQVTQATQASAAPPAPAPVKPAAPAIFTSARVGEVFQEQLQGGRLAPQMVVVPAGRFQLGSDLAAKERFGPQVQIAQPFAMGKYPVTVEEYLAAVEAKACRAPQWLEQGSEYHYANGSDKHYRRLGEALYGKRFPIVGVSWDDAQAYIVWLNASRMHAADLGQYHLPSEAEWEYAARAGSAGKWCFGDDESKLKDYAWYSENSEGKTHEVGGKQGNAFGLYDMHGNVREWVADEYHENYLGAPKDGSVWQEDDVKDKIRVLRGGAWIIDATIARSAYRIYDRPGFRDYFIGFRVARTLPSKTAV